MKWMRLISTAMLLVAVSFGVVGCEEKSDLEKAGDSINEAVDDSADVLEKAGDKVKDAVEE